MTNNKLTKQQQIAEEQKKIFKNRKVVQLNKFIKGDVSAFSVNDLKIFKLIISKVDSKDSLFKDFYEINTDEIKALNINEKHLYSETRKTLKRLANIYITFDEGDTIREVGLIRNDFKFEKYSKKILINFNDDMGEYLVNLKKNFFMYDLIDIVNFRFKHTLKFYEYIKSQSLNVIKLKIETIKDILDLKNKYNRYTNFKNDVLEVIVEEINECSNTLFISYSEEKRGPKVEYIIFHIKRIKNDMLIEAKDSTDKLYSKLIGKECLYSDKYYNLVSINIEDKTIVLSEVYTENQITIIKDNKEGVVELLKSLFPENLKDEKLEDDKYEVKRLKVAKDFKVFRDSIIKEYSGKVLGNNMPGFEPEVIIGVDEKTGYLVNKEEEKIISKEESLKVWTYLYGNQNVIGKVNKINPVEEFLNIEINIKKINQSGKAENLIYMITDIKEEEEGGVVKYRLYSKNTMDPFSDIEKSKSLLTIDELKKFMSQSRVD